MGFYKNTNSGARSTLRTRIDGFVRKVINDIANREMRCVKYVVDVDKEHRVTVSNTNTYDVGLTHVMRSLNECIVRLDMDGYVLPSKFIKGSVCLTSSQLPYSVFSFNLSDDVINYLLL